MELPKDFIERTKPLLGAEWDNFLLALKDTPPTSIRINKNKTTKAPDLETVNWCETGYYLKDRPQFTFDPLLHAGAYYVQEASSMFLEQAAKQLIKGDVRFLDLCAAPGGKSTLISSLISDNSLLVSNEIIRTRANILAENMIKWGNPNSIVTNNRPEDFSKLIHYFDVIVVDAPCSGEGMFRKDHQAIEEWSVDNVKLCAQRQKDILSAIWDSLKPNGYLFYSTCTYNEEENEEIVKWICDTLEGSVVEILINPEWDITTSMVYNKPTFHFYPHKTKGEGLYFAVLQKADGQLYSNKPSKKDKKKQKVQLDLSSYLTNSDDYIFSEEKATIYAIPKIFDQDIELLDKQLNIVHKGINMGVLKGKDFIPDQSLALSKALNKDGIETWNINWEIAIAYLKKETIVLPDAPKGFLLLTYREYPLGFVKNLGNRANNLYPNEWRIRSSNIPSEEVGVLAR